MGGRGGRGGKKVEGRRGKGDGTGEAHNTQLMKVACSQFKIRTTQLWICTCTHHSDTNNMTSHTVHAFIYTVTQVLYS